MFAARCVYSLSPIISNQWGYFTDDALSEEPEASANEAVLYHCRRHADPIISMLIFNARWSKFEMISLRSGPNRAIGEYQLVEQDA